MNLHILREVEQQALDRLLEIASHDTGQSRRVADFLLAWWNADTCGGFDLTDFWAVDGPIAADMLRVIGYITRNSGIYPDRLGYGPQFEQLVRLWRPQLVPGQATQ